MLYMVWDVLYGVIGVPCICSGGRWLIPMEGFVGILNPRNIHGHIRRSINLWLAHSRRLYSTASLGYHVDGTMIEYHTQPHYPDAIMHQKTNQWLLLITVRTHAWKGRKGKVAYKSSKADTKYFKFSLRNVVCLSLFYTLAISKDISGRVANRNSVHYWCCLTQDTRPPAP